MDIIKQYFAGILFFLLLVFCKVGIGTNIVSFPFIKNYPKKEYKAGTQNWSIVQGENGNMFFANNFGVLHFNGLNWRLLEMPNKSVVRSLCRYDAETILAGAYSEFGEIKVDKFGQLTYESWIYKLPKSYRDFDEVWRIFKYKNTVIVQSFEYLFVFENKNFSYAIASDDQFKYSFLVDGVLYVQKVSKGVFEMKGDQLIKLDKLDFFKDKEIWTLITYSNSKFLIGTQFHGFFIFDGKQLMPWDTEANDFIKSNNLFSAIKLMNGNYCFGSIQNGLIIANKDGDILTKLNTSVGLQNNTILSLFEDESNNLWVGLDNGIDYLLTNSPLSTVRKIGGFGTGYASIIFNDILYVGTNQGLYYKNINEKVNSLDSDFKLIESTRGQVWKFSLVDDRLYCCHNNGLFLIKGAKSFKIGDAIGVWDIIKIPNRNDFYLVGTYEGFYILNKEDGAMQKVSGLNESARKFIFDKNDNLLLSHGYKGIYILSLDVEKKEIQVADFFNKENGLPSSFRNEIFKINNEIIAATEVGVYKYSNRDFKKYDLWDRFFETGANNISNIIQSDETKFWCFKDGYTRLITYLNENMYDINVQSFRSIYNSFPRSFENVLNLGDKTYLIGNEDGFVLYEDSKLKQKNEYIPMDLASAQYRYRGSISYNNIEFEKKEGIIYLEKLTYKQHWLKILLSMPYYPDQKLVHHRYRLNNGPWTEWNPNGELKLDDLREGEYFIDIQSSIDQSQVAGDLKVHMVIAPPMYRRWYAYVFYLLLFFSASLLTSFLFKKRIEKEKRREALIQQKKRIENEIKLKRRAEIAQSELIKFKNEKLSTDIRRKSKELANTTMSIIQKNKMLQQLKIVLTDMKKEDVRFRDNHKINNLIKKINKEIDHQDNWTVFEQNFDKVHENFLMRLKGKHQELSAKDMRLAAYLRMNLSSKEIAPLLNISVRSVEISRYRLRKKMDLPHDQNLAEYLISM